MFNYIRGRWMAFKNIFKDDNNINEKNVIGFMSFAVMTIFAVVDLTTGYFGKDLVINEFIYNSFVIITLGCFGIAGLEKFAKKYYLKKLGFARLFLYICYIRENYGNNSSIPYRYSGTGIVLNNQ